MKQLTTKTPLLNLGWVNLVDWEETLFVDAIMLEAQPHWQSCCNLPVFFLEPECQDLKFIYVISLFTMAVDATGWISPIEWNTVLGNTALRRSRRSQTLGTHKFTKPTRQKS